MLAVDANVVVRLLTADEAGQYAEIRKLFSAGPIWIAKTVLLETAWVLGSTYGFEAGTIRNAFRKILGLENVQVEDEASVVAALDLAEQGIDLPDAIHLSVVRMDQALFLSTDRC
jgi:predicted nucleic-acid-binding protein